MFKPILRELKYNAGVSGRALTLDALTLAICAALFFLCDNVLIEQVAYAWPDSSVSYLMTCHAIDCLGGCAFMAYTNLLLDLVKPDMRFKRIIPIPVFMFLCGAFWEYAAPLFVPGSTGDALDIVAYLLGACCYYLLAKAVTHDKDGEADEVMCEGFASMPPEMQEGLEKMLKSTSESDEAWKEIFGKGC